MKCAHHSFHHGTAAKAVAAILMLGACESGQERSSDFYELTNIRTRNVLPASPPAAFVDTFRTYCAETFMEAGNDENIATALRAANYVEGQGGLKGIRAFVVDDRRPAVMFKRVQGGLFCGVSAKARTGQTAHVQRYIQEAFPQARRVDAHSISASAEDVWLIAQHPLTLIYTQRQGAPYYTPSLYNLIIMQEGGGIVAPAKRLN